MKNRKIKNLIDNPRIVLEKCLYTRMGRLLPTKTYLKVQYRCKLGVKLDIKNPRTYSEKIQFLKLNYINNDISHLVDKYEVRKYIENCIGKEFLIPLIGVFESPGEIDFDKLPEKFILKCTHDSQSAVLCLDKNKFNKNLAIKKLSKKLKKDGYSYSREYFYKNLPKRIICEEIIGDGKTAPKDYKFMCFNGKVQFIIVDNDRFTNHSRNIYDPNWGKVNIVTDCDVSDYENEKPEKLNEMIYICEKLSRNYRHVRVDLYYVDQKIYFGELTFMPWAGLVEFTPNEWNYKLGDLITI